MQKPEEIRNDEGQPRPAAPLRPLVFHGRGAIGQPDGRFEARQREAFDDGWGNQEQAPEVPPTTLAVDTSKTVITENSSPDIPFDLSINPYRGCEHGCVYCFARPTHSYLGLSPGLDFETKLAYKPDAPEQLRRELSRRSYRCRPITLGINTDGWQPVERKLRLTRRLLEVLAECRHPVSIVTKSALIERDIDLLGDMARDGLAQVHFSITTLQKDLARTMEPRAATPQRRLEAMQALREAGVPVGVLFAPLIPALNDHELESVLAAARGAGAESAGYVLLRLPFEVADIFETWLQTHAPGRAGHVMSIIRQSRGGKNYDSTWGTRLKGEGVFADLYAQRMKLACRKLGLNSARRELDTSLFRPPEPPDEGAQLRLF